MTTADVARLAARLAEAPPVFLASVDPAEPRAVRIEAVVGDLFRERASRALEASELAAFAYQAKARRHLELVLVASWLLHDECFRGVEAHALLALLGERTALLAELVVARAFVEDPERREELVRVTLQALGIAPAGESPAIAEDRLAALDSVRRDQLLREARARDQEREQRRRELARLRAQEEEERRKAARTTFED
ncbi:MAG: hypothetical protein U0610_01685 [bacterium]